MGMFAASRHKGLTAIMGVRIDEDCGRFKPAGTTTYVLEIICRRNSFSIPELRGSAENCRVVPAGKILFFPCIFK